MGEPSLFPPSSNYGYRYFVVIFAKPRMITSSEILSFLEIPALLQHTSRITKYGSAARPVL